MIEQTKAALLSSPGCIEEGYREVHQPEEGEVLLRVGYVGLCGTDISAYYDGHRVPNYPIVLGHEFSAQIEKLGKGVVDFKEGQWVAIAPLLTCGKCQRCRSNQEHLCEQRKIFGMQVDGALREKLLLPARCAYPLGDIIPPEIGTMAEPLAVCIHAVKRAGNGDLANAKCLIAGAGTIGLLTALVLRAEKAGQVTLVDINNQRLSIAQELGFEICHATQTPHSLADILIIATDAPQAISNIPNFIALRGTAVVVGITGQAPLDWTSLLLKEATITTSRYFTKNDFEGALELLRKKVVDPTALIQDRAAFPELFVDSGSTVMSRAKDALRLVIKM